MERHDLISYAMNFAAFLIRKKPKIERIILFGSVARGDFDGESDIDLFIDAPLNRKDIEPILELYEISEENKKYRIEGLKNEIRVKAGKLDEWKSVERSIISDGILLYGKFKEMPKGINGYILFKMLIGKMERKNKMKVWRRLYGYKQKIGNKVYYSKGLIEETNGRKLCRGLFTVPTEKSNEIIDFLRKNKVGYEVKEIFSDDSRTNNKKA